MFKDNADFYPTPTKLINKMLTGIDFKFINSVLEPSAGKGDIAEAVTNKFKFAYNYNRNASYDIDTIEINENLRHILHGKKYRIVHDDFLTYSSMKKYDLIIMNPPFSGGDKHLLKAIELQKSGGQIVCLLNAETLRNPYSNSRKILLQQLDEYNAEIEYINDAFINAERITSIDIAMIKINISKKESSIILDALKKEEVFREDTACNSGHIVDADFINSIIARYNFEVKAGLKLIAEYNALEHLMLRSIKKEYGNDSVLSLDLKYKDQGHVTLENGYIMQIRLKYWEALFTAEEFVGLFTNNLREKYMARINDLKDYDFSLFNINTIQKQLHQEMIQSVENTILALFEEFSNKHHWHDETSKNIHYYNGWKTNKSWKINKKVIIPLSGFNSWDSSRIDYDYNVLGRLSDIEKVFNYLDGGVTEENNIKEALKTAQHYGETKKIPLKYFAVTFYKKGTCHIEFANEELLHKFNLYGSQRKGWLPPSYSKAKYKDMTPEEKSVIDEFEGEESYRKVMSNKDYYIVETSKLLMLA